MPEFSTLVTVVTADVSGFTANFATAEQAAKHFGQAVPKAMQDATNGIQAFQNKLHDAVSGLRGFRETIQFAFGFNIGRTLFEKIHEGIVTIAEGFSEGTKAGEGFFDSLNDGILKLAGFRTRAEEITETTKKLTDAMGGLAAFREKRDNLFSPAGSQFPNVKGGDKLLEEATKARDEAAKAAFPGNAKLAELQKQLADTWANGAPISITAGKGGLGLTTQGGMIEAIEGEIQKVKADYAVQFATLQSAESALSGTKTDLTARNFWSKEIPGLIFSGGSLTGNDTTSAFARRMETLVGGTAGGAIGAAQSALWAPLGFLAKSVLGGAANTILPDKNDFLRQQRETQDEDRRRQDVLEGLHPDLKRARLREEALGLGLNKSDLDARFKQIDDEENKKGVRKFSGTDVGSLHDILQQEVMNDPKAAQRDDWMQQTAKAVTDINGKIVAPPPGQPNPWQFVA